MPFLKLGRQAVKQVKVCDVSSILNMLSLRSLLDNHLEILSGKLDIAN